MATDPTFILGIDLGTTSVKVSLYDAQTNRPLQSAVCETHAGITQDSQPQGADEQATNKIFEACEMCLSKLDISHLARVKRIGIAGQMHGCVCWYNCGTDDIQNCLGFSKLTHFHHSVITSPLFTWQDSRCTEEFLATLPAPDSHLKLAMGHGCATLFWLQRHNPDFLGKFTQAGTVMDLLVAMLCGLDAPIMSVQNAASWGYFNVTQKQWNKTMLAKVGFPVYLLPEVTEPGTVVGKLQSTWHGIPADCEVGVAMGDLPCSVLPSMQSQNDGVLNISTSAQLVTSTPLGFQPLKSTSSSTVEYFPYFRGQYLAVAAALTGGNALACLVSTLQQFASEFGVHISKEDTYSKLIERGLEFQETDMIICPTLYGERHVPSQRASIQNLTTENMHIGAFSRALCHGIITNLHSMISRKELIDKGVKRIVGCGSALLRNKVLRQELEKVYQMPVEYKQGGDAAEGAALAMLLYREDGVM